MRLLWRDVAIGNGPPINTSLTAREIERLRELAEGQRVLEIGSAYGYSTCGIAQVAEHVTAVDPHTGHGSLYALEANLNAYGVRDRVDIVAEPSQVAMPRFIAEGRKFGLIWIDGDHTADVVRHDVAHAQKLVAPDGWIACHDYDEDTCPGVREALDDMFGGPGDRVDTLAVYFIPGDNW